MMDNHAVLMRLARLSGTVNGGIAEENQPQLLSALVSLSQHTSPKLEPLTPLVYRNLIQSGISRSIPYHVLGKLKQTTMRMVAKNLLQQQWLEGFIKQLKESNISIILLKGAAFNGTIYPPNAPRIGVDIDFLSTKTDFEQVCALLEKTLSLVPAHPDWKATHERLFERVFISPNSSLPPIELHRALTNPYIFRINYDDLWSNSRVHPQYGAPIHILSAEDTLQIIRSN